MPHCFYAVSRVIDLAIEWQTFNNEAHDADTSAANTLLNEVNLTTLVLNEELDFNQLLHFV
jgi:hypothetical protein